jgi:hypothetical protein
MNYMIGSKMSAATQRDALARYVHRMTVENRREHPNAVEYQLRNGYRLRLLTDAEWLACTSFAVRNDGRLSDSVHYCTTCHPDFKPSRSDNALDHGRAAIAANQAST